MTVQEAIDEIMEHLDVVEHGDALKVVTDAISTSNPTEETTEIDGKTISDWYNMYNELHHKYIETFRDYVRTGGVSDIEIEIEKKQLSVNDLPMFKED